MAADKVEIPCEQINQDQEENTLAGAKENEPEPSSNYDVKT